MADIRVYINPFALGETESGQRACVQSGDEVYVETRNGNVINKFIRGLRKGSIVKVKNAYCIAPGGFRSQKRKRLFAEYFDAIKAAGAVVLEWESGRLSKGNSARMVAETIERVGQSGKRRRGSGRGAPSKWPRSPATLEDYTMIWQNRKYKSDPARRAAIIAKYRYAPSISWLRQWCGTVTR